MWKVDHFARNVGDHFSVKTTLAKHGVEIVSVTEPIDANPEGRLMETILAGFAQFDNETSAQREPCRGCGARSKTASCHGGRPGDI